MENIKARLPRFESHLSQLTSNVILRQVTYSPCTSAFLTYKMGTIIGATSQRKLWKFSDFIFVKHFEQWQAGSKNDVFVKTNNHI